METWMWISLYTVQTFVGAVLWRKYRNSPGQAGENPKSAIMLSATVVFNIFGAVVLFCMLFNTLFNKLYYLIDFLAGVKNKETEGIKCTGNNGNGCFIDSCGHNCGCQGIGDKK